MVENKKIPLQENLFVQHLLQNDLLVARTRNKKNKIDK